MEKKLCLECHAMLIGRADKKFCDSYCKTAYHNKNYKSSHQKIKGINNLLKKNRQILKIFCEAGIVETTYQSLLQAGFHFQYFTHQFTNSNNLKIHYCYEFGYIKTMNDQIIILSDLTKGFEFKETLKISFN